LWESVAKNQGISLIKKPRNVKFSIFPHQTITAMEIAAEIAFVAVAEI
jgi:hypothetical protein